MSFDEDFSKLSQPSPKARLFAIIPVVLIGAFVMAFVYGMRLEGRRYTTAPWRTHAVAEHNFSITTPGTLMSIYQNMDFDGAPVTAQSYVGSDMGTDFSVTVAQRPETDTRSIEDVAKSLGVRDVKPVPGVAGATALATDFVIEGERTQARLIFKDRTLYQLMAAGPVKTFPEDQAQRFFSSFKLTDK